MLQDITAELSETIKGGNRGLRWTKSSSILGDITRGIGSPSISISPTVSPVIIAAPFLTSSYYSFNLLGNNNSFNTSGKGISIIDIGQ
jgi:hypothetical protein